MFSLYKVKYMITTSNEYDSIFQVNGHDIDNEKFIDDSCQYGLDFSEEPIVFNIPFSKNDDYELIEDCESQPIENFDPDNGIFPFKQDFLHLASYEEDMYIDTTDEWETDWERDGKHTKESFIEIIDAYFQPYNNKKGSWIGYDVGNDKSKAATILEINKIVQKIIQEKKFMYYEKALYEFNGKFWSRINGDTLSAQLVDYIPHKIVEKMNTHNLLEMYKRIKISKDIVRPKDKIVSNPRYICFDNGLYDIYEDRMFPHDANIMTFMCIDVNYLPYNTCSGDRFEEYLSMLSYGDMGIRQRILETIGYIMSDFNCAKAIPLFIGDRNSGKTTLGNLMAMIVGDDNTTSTNFDLELKYIPVTLYGKKLCTVTDLSSARMRPEAAAMIKQLSGGDLIAATVKYKESFAYHNTCKLVFASNYMPNLPHNDKALEERWIKIPFLRSLSRDDINVNLLQELKEELPYIIKVSMEALRGLIDNNFKFTSIGEYEDSFASAGEYLTIGTANYIEQFIEEKCVIGIYKKVLISNLYQNYQLFCSDNKIIPIAGTVFSKELRKILGNAIRDGGHSNGRSLYGIGLIDYPECDIQDVEV